MASAPPRIIHNNFSGQFNVAFVSISSQPNYEHTNNYNNNMQLLITQKQAVFAFAVSALLNILQLKYDGNAHSPFDTHPKIMGIAVISFIVYCLACDAELRISSMTRISPNYAHVIHHVVTLVGYFSLASLASILVFPVSVRPIVYLVLVLFSLWLLHRVQKRVLIGGGYIYNSPTRLRPVDVPLIHAFVDTDTLPV